jgi:hypothetical protein
MMDSSPPSKTLEPSLPSTAGVKRPAPTLLPPFEPLSSSPGFPRPIKRQARVGSGGNNAYLKYPTPVPTSSTGILSSSPPRVGTRPGLARTQSSLSERAPLSAVPSIELNENGETLLMGRSSNSSHYQLSANRLVSRIHVKARYVPASAPLEPNKIEIICNGWNGLKLHCQGRTWELQKGDSFTSETEGTDIMLDVQDARVMIQWPKKDRNETLANLSDSSWDDSPRSRVGGAASGLLQSSPLRRQTRIASPESPTPGSLPSSQRLQALLPGAEEDGVNVEIYEDASADEENELPAREAETFTQSMATEATNSFSSDLSEPDENDPANDPDEENDPIVHSFGPFGANISNRLASITTASPKFASPKRSALPAVLEEEGTRSHTLSASPTSLSAPPESPKAIVVNPAVSNHVINQLAFSRLSSTPLSTIMNNLPAEEKKDLDKDQLRRIIEGMTCIGTIQRQGKDAAGKALESEYYYIPEADDDAERRAAVVDGLRKPSLRNCRKQHKVRDGLLAILDDTIRICTDLTVLAILLEAPQDAVRCTRLSGTEWWLERRERESALRSLPLHIIVYSPPSRFPPSVAELHQVTTSHHTA